MKCLPLNTEERIKEAAKKVFLAKGFDGTTTRDIAKEAGLNSALMNYYFRSKEKLFCSVFQEMLQLFFEGITNVLNKPIGLKEKVAEMIEHEFQMFRNNPHLSIFVFNEVHRDPDRFLKAFPLPGAHIAQFERQLNEAIASGAAQPVEAKHVLALIFSNIKFIFLGKAITMQIWQMTEEDFEQFAQRHKEIVIQLVTNYLFEPQQVT